MNLSKFFIDNAGVEVGQYEGKTWGYHAGISGTVVVSASETIMGISAYAASGGSMTINGGDSIPLPAGISVTIQPRAWLYGATIVFTNTNTYIIEALH